MRHLLTALAAGGLLVAGCASVGQETWSKPGTTGQALARDAADCEREARFDLTHGQEQGSYGFSVPRNDRVFAACMRARGYERVTSARS